jgi:hypothetical protein
MTRPWEAPNDYDKLKSTGAIKPSLLYHGSDLARYTMITAEKPLLVLYKLAEGKGVLEAEYALLTTWLENNRPELKPYIKISDVRKLLFVAVFLCGMLRRLWVLISSRDDFVIPFYI